MQRPPRPQDDRSGPVTARRRVLQGLVATSALSLSACGGLSLGGPPDPNARGRAGLLLPLTGARSDLGQMLRSAASLGGTTVGAGAEIEVLDTGDDSATAVRAARAAVEAGARMLIGPLFSEQARAVAGAVPKSVPVVALSNDDSLARDGVFVFGVTPLHSARAVLGFAATKGLRDVAVAVPPGAFGARAVEGAQAAAREAGVTLRAPIVTNDAATLARGLGGAAAVYLPSAGPELDGFVATARAAGVQALGSVQWSGLDLEARADFEGAWFAAPDPLRFASFAQTLEAQGLSAGIVTGLAFDGVELARLLGRIEQQNRKGLLRREGFRGVLGPYKFQSSGVALRGLAVLSVQDGRIAMLGSTGV